MKLVSVVLAALAATAVQAGPMNRWCMFPGQVCGKSKRAFDAIDAIDEVKRSADAMAEAQLDLNRWCMFPGQVCGKAKRAIDAIDNVKRSADAVAEAMAFLDDLSDEDYAKIKDAQ
ncbi:mating alpha-pheromone PpgA [Aspergillus stella-maris]|uniref:mating alpha-pheromone PpgA n=1 Tax=Aspergillus stella-maris TaxID=1810926 RepID=UPI003CCD1013